MIMTKLADISPSGYSLTDYHVEVLLESWNAKLLDMCRQSPVKAGKLNIHFDRSPDILMIPKFTSYFQRPLGFFHHDQLIGFAIACYQKRYINGELMDVIYLGNMHVTEKGAGRTFLKMLTERVIHIVENLPEVKYLYAYIMEDNRSAKRLADMGQLGSKPIGSITMSTIFTLKPIRESNGFMIRKATLSDVEKMVRMLSNEYRSYFLSPVINVQTFLCDLKLRPGVDIDNYYLAIRNGTIVGLCLAWDMTSFKKNRISYKGNKLKLQRCLYNLAAQLLGSPKLPGSGDAFRDITIAEYAVRDRDPKILEALLRHVYREYRKKGAQAIIIGSSSNDPIIQALKPFISKEVRSNVIIAPLQKDSKQTFRDIPFIYADSIQI